MATPLPIAAARPRRSSTDAQERFANLPVAAWLFACSALVFAIVVVGGVTRLTHSGLSITEWQPIVGAVPPLSDADWNVAFDKYRATPEYRQVNSGMTLAEFKSIFWWEYAHRLLGRLVGLAFFVPLVAFIVARRISAALALRLVAIFTLGALQGALGWFMVQSGLVDDPRVSPFRLAAHLGLALAIFAAMLWTAMSLVVPPRAAPGESVARLRRIAYVSAGLVFVMALSGALVAGIRAGFAYNTFPLMNGSIIPPEIFMLEPWWKNFFWNMATVQFDHRLIAVALAIVAIVLWRRIHSAEDSPQRAIWGANAFVAMLVVQIALGIATLLYVVPLPLAALHQAGAVLTFGLALNVAHALR